MMASSRLFSATSLREAARFSLGARTRVGVLSKAAPRLYSVLHSVLPAGAASAFSAVACGGQ